jgi:hypothetical protein
LDESGTVPEQPGHGRARGLEKQTKVRPMTALTRQIHQRTICGRSKSCFMTGGRRNTGIKELFIRG